MKKIVMATVAAIGMLSASTVVMAQEKNDVPVKMKKMHNKMHNAHNKYWEQTDADKDGKLNKAEVLAEASKNFDDRDLDHDGYLTKEEMHSFYAKKIGGKYPQWHDRVEPETLNKKDLKQFKENNELIKKQYEKVSANTYPTPLDRVETEDVYKQLAKEPTVPTVESTLKNSTYPTYLDRVEPEDVK